MNIPLTKPEEAGLILQFVQHGRVLCEMLLHNDAELADVTARVFLMKNPHLDGVIMKQFKYGEEITRQLDKTARKAIRKAYKEGLL